GAGGDPLLERVDLPGAERVLGPRRRHDVLVRMRGDALDEDALVRLAGDDGWPRLAAAQGRVALVQTQLALAVLLVHAVAVEAMLRENGPDVAIEGERRRLRVGRVVGA